MCASTETGVTDEQNAEQPPQQQAVQQQPGHAVDGPDVASSAVDNTEVVLYEDLVKAITQPFAQDTEESRHLARRQLQDPKLQ